MVSSTLRAIFIWAGCLAPVAAQGFTWEELMDTWDDINLQLPIPANTAQDSYEARENIKAHMGQVKVRDTRMPDGGRPSGLVANKHVRRPTAADPRWLACWTKKWQPLEQLVLLDGLFNNRTANRIQRMCPGLPRTAADNRCVLQIHILGTLLHEYCHIIQEGKDEIGDRKEYAQRQIVAFGKEKSFYKLVVDTPFGNSTPGKWGVLNCLIDEVCDLIAAEEKELGQ